MTPSDDKLTISEASQWASSEFESDITPSNISYLIQYGRVRKLDVAGTTMIYKRDLFDYYTTRMKQEQEWKEQLGDDLNWTLSFDAIKEKERTKHVHRLHPYKGKFIPQLVEYFLDAHTDDFKKKWYFYPGDIVLDPFCGSGTTLVQANELGMHAVGIDVSHFNTLISNVKVGRHDLATLQKELKRITDALRQFVAHNIWQQFDDELSTVLSTYNNEHFPSPDYKYRVRTGDIDQASYAAEKEAEFLAIYHALTDTYDLDICLTALNESFLESWYLPPVRQEIDFVKQKIDQIAHVDTRRIASVILSRTIRSCRATTHADLATLKDPITQPYYCRKHYKICKPLLSILGWWERYSKDTVKRLVEFAKLRTNTHQICITGDSRTIDIQAALQQAHPELSELVEQQKIRGIFSSPPYVGLIDYHEQHAYAYELFQLERRDALEIGPLYKGTGQDAQASYIEGIAQVLRNCQHVLQDNYDVFLVANDRHQLYPQIAAQAGMQIVNAFRRPVLHRTEKDKSAYDETIFHMKAAD